MESNVSFVFLLIAVVSLIFAAILFIENMRLKLRIDLTKSLYNNEFVFQKLVIDQNYHEQVLSILNKMSPREIEEFSFHLTTFYRAFTSSCSDLRTAQDQINQSVPDPEKARLLQKYIDLAVQGLPEDRLANLYVSGFSDGLAREHVFDFYKDQMDMVTSQLRTENKPKFSSYAEDRLADLINKEEDANRKILLQGERIKLHEKFV